MSPIGANVAVTVMAPGLPTAAVVVNWILLMSTSSDSTFVKLVLRNRTVATLAVEVTVKLLLFAGVNCAFNGVAATFGTFNESVNVTPAGTLLKVSRRSEPLGKASPLLPDCVGDRKADAN